MLKKISASAAVLAIAGTVLTGCSGKLSTEETCNYINDQAQEQNLKQKMTDAGSAIATGDATKFRDATAELASVMKDAAGKTSDEKLADALTRSADLSNKMAEAMGDDSLDLVAMAAKMQEFQTPEFTEASTYLTTACPSMPALD